jgi:hypothetical protein
MDPYRPWRVAFFVIGVAAAVAVVAASGLVFLLR